MKFSLISFAFFWTFTSCLQAQTAIGGDFFQKADAFFQIYVQDGKVAYDQLKNDRKLVELAEMIAGASLEKADDATKQAFYINAYNLLVVRSAAEAYPVRSVLEVPGFFDSQKYQVGGQWLTLNQLEKEKLLAAYGDPRFHFVLVCGAIDCPPVISSAYRPETLESQLEVQTRRALNDPGFIRTDTAARKVLLSQLFEWYADDFGGRDEIIPFINRYRAQPLPDGFETGFYPYDWALNDQTGEEPSFSGNNRRNNASRYVVSSSIPKGTTETKLFNNLYTQKTGNVKDLLTDRASFFTAFLSFLYGVDNRFNAGFDLRYRMVRNDRLPASPLEVFTFENTSSSRQAIATIGPKIRYAPFAALPNFSIQSAFWIPLQNDLAGTAGEPYLDWNGPSWWTQFFNDFSIGSNFAAFTEIDFFWEDIGASGKGRINRVSTPVTLIFSYFPNPKTTLYLLNNFSPYWQSDFDYFFQSGAGAKYQFSPKFEVELLYTYFTNEYLRSIGGQASTFNIGIRVNR